MENYTSKKIWAALIRLDGYFLKRRTQGCVDREAVVVLAEVEAGNNIIKMQYMKVL